MDNTNEESKSALLCMGERDYFPEDEFTYDSDGLPFIHNPKERKPDPQGVIPTHIPRHYVFDGSLVNPDDYPVPGTQPEGSGDGSVIIAAIARRFSGVSLSLENDLEVPIVADWLTSTKDSDTATEHELPPVSEIVKSFEDEARDQLRLDEEKESDKVKQEKSTDKPDADTIEGRKLIARYQLWLDERKARYQLWLDEEKARYQLWLDEEKARDQLQLDEQKARDQVKLDVEKARYQLQLDEQKARYQLQLDDRKAIWDAHRQQIKDGQSYDYLRGQALYSAYLDVAKGQIDRSQARAGTVVTAAGAIGTLYAAILGLAFGLGGAQTKPLAALPIRGMIPAFFLGVAIFAATFYLAYIKAKGDKFKYSRPSGLPSLRLREERDDFIRWTSLVVIRRLPWLHAAIASLAIGVIFLPVAFLQVSDSGALWLAVLFTVVAAVLVVISSLNDRKVQNPPTPISE